MPKRPTQYQRTYTAKSPGGFSLKRRSTSRRKPTPSRHQSDSYRKVGWKVGESA